MYFRRAGQRLAADGQLSAHSVLHLSLPGHRVARAEGHGQPRAVQLEVVHQRIQLRPHPRKPAYMYAGQWCPSDRECNRVRY